MLTTPPAATPANTRIFIGFDPAERRAHVVAMQSLRSTMLHFPYPVERLALLELTIGQGIYTRPTSYREINGRTVLWDGISDAPMTTEHAIARFFVPYLCHYQGWALFTDGDVLFRDDVVDLFALADPHYAVQVVQHPAMSAIGDKKDGQPQTTYARKNWSSVMLWNCAHPAHQRLTLQALNAYPGRDLHQFAWLPSEAIGALPLGWNYLVGESQTPADKLVHLAHFTLGTPDLPGHEKDPYAAEWRATARRAGIDLTVGNGRG